MTFWTFKLWKWLSARQLVWALEKTRPMSESRTLPLFATRRWAVLVVRWPVEGDPQ